MLVVNASDLVRCKYSTKLPIALHYLEQQYDVEFVFAGIWFSCCSSLPSFSSKSGFTMWFLLLSTPFVSALAFPLFKVYPKAWMWNRTGSPYRKSVFKVKLVGMVRPWFTLLWEWSTGSRKKEDIENDLERKREGRTTSVSTKDGGISSSLSALCGRGTEVAEQWRSVEVRHHRNRDESKITASINCLNALLWNRFQVPTQTPQNHWAVELNFIQWPFKGNLKCFGITILLFILKCWLHRDEFVELNMSYSGISVFESLSVL